jgi:hypothetical protein
MPILARTRQLALGGSVGGKDDGILIGSGQHCRDGGRRHRAGDHYGYVISDPASRTADLGGPLGTKAFGERVAAQMSAD